jgi:DNA-binding NarL/FixJ family response regulator
VGSGPVAVGRIDVPVLARLQVLYGLARAQVLAGDRGRGAETLAELRSAAGAVGAGLLTDWADQLEASAGLSGRTVDRSTTRRSPLGGAGAGLVAEGLSNGQIAERLYISRKTVSVHVSAILRKTGAASRTEAVRLAAR